MGLGNFFVVGDQALKLQFCRSFEDDVIKRCSCKKLGFGMVTRAIKTRHPWESGWLGRRWCFQSFGFVKKV